MNNVQFDRIEEMLMALSSKMCRKMNHEFVNVILKDISKDLATHHFMILKILKDNDKLYVTEIVNSLGITKSQMTASVDKLLNLGFVTRSTDPNDRRKYYISISEQGLEITKLIIKKMKNRFYTDIKILSQSELDDLEKGLSVLNKFCKLGSRNKDK